MRNRPSELQEFYERNGAPLEIQMPVEVIRNDNFKNEYIVTMIRANVDTQRIDVLITDDRLESNFQFSPCDLKINHSHN